jgi:hypothetical protein
MAQVKFSGGRSALPRRLATPTGFGLTVVFVYFMIIMIIHNDYS